MYRNQDDDEGYVDPVDGLGEKVFEMSHHVGEHCHFFDEVFGRIERLENNQFKSAFIVCGIISAIVFVFMLGFMTKSNQHNEERIDKIEKLEFFKKGN